ncbi:MAG: penicillin-binding transpeptidase domain-containing protein [bacterium]|nr:penicillin-binding transpeptidase domain-containing protein [bacterium]
MKPGVAFGDYIKTETENELSMRGFLFPIFTVIVVGVLVVKLISLQLLQGASYRNLSDNNRIRTEIIHAPRGVIFDRNNIPLVFNVPGFRKTVGGKTVLIDRKKALELIAKGGNDLEIDSHRQYPYKEEMAHVLGYIGQISKEELGNLQFKDYRISDMVGKTGIEKNYESLLKGIDGKKLVEVDSRGVPIRTLGQTDATPGNDITLAIDAKLQSVAFNALSRVKKGAVVVSTLNGEILVVVSKPSFDSNLFTLGEGYKSSESSYLNVSDVLTDSENQPFLNRAISGTYPPGSTFKLITAAAGLEGKFIDENFEVEDTGILQVGAFSFGNWYFLQYGKTEGMVNVVKGIKRSNDIFFYKLAEKVGVDKISQMAKKFGLGERLGIDLEGEAKGIVPTPDWKKEVIGEPWYLGDTYHYGIGQGYVLATPLQVNMWTAVIANKGILYRPHLLKNSAFAKASADKQKFLSNKTVGLIREGMVQSCSPGGVGWPLFEFKVKSEKLKVDGKNFFEVPQSTVSASFKDYRRISIACKTGTAQHGGEKDVPHAWITLFAPAYDPQIIITVLAESSGEGSNIAAPIAKKILEEWFNR